jgi:hypothetical protein
MERHDKQNTTMTCIYNSQGISLTHVKEKEKWNFLNMKMHTFMITLW